MEFQTFVDLALAEESFKTVGLIILWQMRGELKQLKVAMKDLADKLANHEIMQEQRFSNHESRLKTIETKLNP
jgi:hypothetical protein